MRVCVYGLGAVGGLVAARLARAGVDVVAVARGETLSAVRREGLRLVEPGPDGDAGSTVRLEAVEDPAELGERDLVVLAVKSQALPAVAARLGPLVGSGTAVLPAVNGVPWWFLRGLPGWPGLRLPSVDPTGALAAAVPDGAVVGSVLHLAASTPAPGVVRHDHGERVIVGDPSGAPGRRTRGAAEVLREGGFAVEVTEDVRREVWFKLWGNMTMNPLSAITGATLDRILADALVREFASRCMREAAEVGARIGVPIADDPEDRHALTARLGALRTSMLQDVEAGRALELDALVTAVSELGDAVGVDTPDIDALLGLARLQAEVRGLYRSTITAPV